MKLSPRPSEGLTSSLTVSVAPGPFLFIILKCVVIVYGSLAIDYEFSQDLYWSLNICRMIYWLVFDCTQSGSKVEFS